MPFSDRGCEKQDENYVNDRYRESAGGEDGWPH